MISKNTICLWYDKDALEAAQFYARTFPDSAVGRVLRAPGDYPSGTQGDVLTVEFTVAGVACLGLNGGTAFAQTRRFRFRSPPTTRRKPTACGTPSLATAARKAPAAGARTNGACRGRSRRARLTEAIADPDPAAAKRAFEAMMTMGKIDIAAIEAARRG